MKNLKKNITFLLGFVVQCCPFYIPFMLITSVTSLVGPIATVLVPKLITDELLKGTETSKIVYLIVFVVFFNIVRIIVKTIYTECYVPFAQAKVQKKINIVLMNKVVSLDADCYDDPDFFQIYTRALEQADKGFKDFLTILTDLFDRLVYIATIISIISVLDPALMLFSIVCTILMFFFGGKESRYRHETEKETTYFNRISEYSKRIHYQVQYVKDLRAYPLAKLLRENYADANTNKQNVILRRSKGVSWMHVLSESLRIIILQLIVMVYLVLRIKSGALEISSFVALFLANIQFSTELFFFVNCYKRFYKISLQTEDLLKIIDCDNVGGSIRLYELDNTNDIKRIDVNAVSFKYHGQSQSALCNVQIHLSQGDHVALVGYNGSGKSTLVKLISGLYTPTEGVVEINGIDVKELGVDWLKNKIGVVYQDYYCYALTIAENVLMRRLESEEDRENVVKALKMSGLYEYISTLPKGIDTILTREFDEGGTVLSGGQCQKLALSRIFVHTDKEIIILDEIVGALDPVSEQFINNQIMEFCKDKILIIVSHHLSTTKMVDKIFYLEKGKIEESGTHDELMSVNGKYAQMYAAQASSYS
ncbi:MAG: ABC transporter ATP-binding protein [Lachnospiraceae bacterium]|nr:ABC transporter ATP-binding protein [Lachnospiraceae bacterium]